MVYTVGSPIPVWVSGGIARASTQQDGVLTLQQPKPFGRAGVAFARDLSRLGYGGGTYDRYIANCSTRPLLIGLAFADTLVDSLPKEAHDWTMETVVTEDGYILGP